MGGDRGGGSGRWQPADFEQLEPERLNLREHAVQRGAVGQRPGQHGVAAAGPGLQGGERRAYRLAQAAADTDAGSCCDLPEPDGRFSAVNGSRARSPTVTYRAWRFARCPLIWAACVWPVIIG